RRACGRYASRPWVGSYPSLDKPTFAQSLKPLRPAIVGSLACAARFEAETALRSHVSTVLRALPTITESPASARRSTRICLQVRVSEDGGVRLPSLVSVARPMAACWRALRLTKRDRAVPADGGGGDEPAVEALADSVNTRDESGRGRRARRRRSRCRPPGCARSGPPRHRIRAANILP